MEAQRNGMLPAGYKEATEGVGLVERRDRGLIAVEGNDRAAWLNNLVSNEVKNLRPGDGNYAFATDRTGRILFDLNLLVLDDAIWLDVGRDWVDIALKHLDRYLITEEVTIHDRTGDGTRLGLVGPKSGALAQAFGLERLPVMTQLQNTALPVADAEATLFRHDFAGVLGVEMIVCGSEPSSSLRDAVRSAGRALGLADVSAEALDVLRIEAGIPWMGRDILEDTLPAETGQFDRGVSYQKGCYLGQEVIERMRSRGALARQLVGLTFEGATPPPAGAAVEIDGSPAGKVTSVCISPVVGAPIGLGYVSPAQAASGTPFTVRADQTAVAGTIATLPFRTDECSATAL